MHPVCRNALAENARVFGQVALGERWHHTARAGISDLQANGFANADRLAYPIVFDEAFQTCRVDDQIGTETPNLEATLRIQSAQLIDGAGGQDMQGGIIKKRAGRCVANVRQYDRAGPALFSGLYAAP